ncbi:hypothetical protein SPAN111604_14010 [Sphingomonas antarctica]|uniref:hypothetical protein n=1 Tax=Sphingomonas antarctica TaxID=2040274 RepID=UPI0039EC160D
MKPLLPLLFLVQFLSWSAMFCLWVYAVPVIAASRPFNEGYASAATTAASGFALYAVLGACIAFAGPRLIGRFGAGATHGASLIAASAGMMLFGRFPFGFALLSAFTLIGVGWASMSSIPYALASAAAPEGGGAKHMRVFAFSTVVPQVAVTLLLASLGPRLALWPPSLVIMAGSAAMLLSGCVSLIFQHRMNVIITDW